MDRAEARRRFADARVATLATLRPDGAPHVVPFVSALEDETIVSVVDRKPKRRPELQRLANIERDARVSVLADGYDEDWRRLWWVRADGVARVVPDGAELANAIRALASKYPQYVDDPPVGPAIVIDVTAWRWWSAS